VFIALYRLSTYIKQTLVVFKGLKFSTSTTVTALPVLIFISQWLF